ncbi:MAG: histidine kinase [Lachnospiraceae bacterium]|nr:histidine kinase [Lachnospiraceae bacterium]
MKKKISAKSILFRILMIFVIPFLLFLIGLNIYWGQNHRDQIYEKNMGKLTMYQSSLEETLKRVDYYLSDCAVNDKAFECLRYPLSEVENYLHLYNLQEKMRSVVLTVDTIDALYIMTLQDDMYGSTYNTRMTMDEKENMLSYLRRLLSEEEDRAISDWDIHEVEGRNYFIKVIGGKGVYCIGVMDAEYISQVSTQDEEKSYILFARENQFLSHREQMEDQGIRLPDQERFCISGTHDEWMVIQSASHYLNCDLVLVEAYEGIWAAETTPFFLLVAPFLFGCLMLFCYHLLEKKFLAPLRQMVMTMDQIAEGELTVRLDAKTDIIEYDTVNRTFNHMIEQISELKILAYDRLIQAQQAQLQYYQIQIRPHFFLNCMKNLYAMTASGNYQQMQEMILVLSDYLRSVFKEHAAMIPLRKEVESAEFYVRLQQMVCPVPPLLFLDIEEELLDFPLPPMSVLTFVENSLRYPKEADSVFQMHISAHKRMDGEHEIVNLTIMDNGSGFEEESLKILNDPQKRMPENHIGIYNVKKRFELIYGQKCSFVFSNMNGACVDIFIPYQLDGKELAGEVSSYEAE